MISKAIFIFATLTIINAKAFSQQSRYFKNFDFYKMNGRDTLNDLSTPPNFYIKCLYNKSDSLIEIYSFSKLNFDYLHRSGHISVTELNGKKLLFLGAGKTRDGYTRGLFQKKIYESDSAFVTHDTLIYKKTSEKYIRIQFFTNINSDSIFFSQVIFPSLLKKDRKYSKLASFTFYKEWFTIDSSASQIVSGIIKLKNDPILIRTEIKSDGYLYLLNITKNNLNNKPGMPITLFWLKDSGLLN